MNFEFAEEAAPVYRRPVEDNPFVVIVNSMPVVGDDTEKGQVAPGTAGSARSFVVPGTAETKGDNANADLTKAIRKLTDAANIREGGAVSVRKDVTVVAKPVKSKGEPGSVKVLFYLVPKIRRSQSAVNSTPATTGNGS